MPSLTVENYLKSILQLTSAGGGQPVMTGQLAVALNVSPGTVTSMLKTLSDSGLAKYKPYSGASLTTSGKKLALRMIRRHRLIELFLVKTLSLTWDQVHEEAEHMEHAVSDELIERIDEFLGFPRTDPHGDPIPSADGAFPEMNAGTLPFSKCLPSSRVRVSRVVNQQADFLRFLSECGLEIGVEAVVQENSPAAGIVTARVGNRHVSLGLPAADQVLVEPVK